MLSRLVTALGTHSYSGSEMKRVFSVQTDTHRDKYSRMTSSTLDSHLQIRDGMEDGSSRVNCDVCVAKKAIAQKDVEDVTETEVRFSKKIVN